MADVPSKKPGQGGLDPSKTRLFHSPGPTVPKPAARKAPPPLPAARPDWHKTRVLPIEHLLPGLASHHGAAVDHLQRTHKLDRAKAARAVARLLRQRVYAWAVCIVLWVSVAAASGMPSLEPPAVPATADDCARAVTIHTRAPTAEPAHDLTLRAADSSHKPAAARAARSALPLPAAAPISERNAPRVSPRAALEALAAGDALAAANLYAALSKQSPENLAYARAARILMQRVQAQSGDTP